METISFDYLINNEKIKEKASLCIGVFDGLHLGHREIFNKCIEDSSFPIVMTFNQNPKMFCGKQKKLKSLNTFSQRNDFFEKMGFKLQVIIDFSAEISKLSAVEFISIICSKLDIEKLVVGQDFKIGSFESQAGPKEIQEILTSHNFKTKVVIASPILDCLGDVISSSKLRELILKGSLDVVQSMLGNSYQLDLGLIPSQSFGGELLIKKGEVSQLLPEYGVFEGLWDETKLETIITIGDDWVKISKSPSSFKKNRFLNIIRERGNN